MTAPLGKTLTVGFDKPTMQFLRIVAATANFTVARVVRTAIDHYLAQPVGTPIDRVRLQMDATSAITRFRNDDPTWSSFEKWEERTDLAPSAERVRVPVSVSRNLRTALEERAQSEHCGFAELVRSAVDCYLAELIAGNAFSKVDRDLLTKMSYTTI